MLSLLCVVHMVPEALQELPICFDFCKLVATTRRRATLLSCQLPPLRAEGSKNQVYDTKVYDTKISTDNSQLSPR